MIVPERDSSKSIDALFKDQFGFSQTTFSGYLKVVYFLFVLSCLWGIYYIDDLSYPVIFTSGDF